MPACSSSTCSQLLDATPDDVPDDSATTTASSGPADSAVARSAATEPENVGRGSSTATTCGRTPRAESACVTAAASSGRSETTAHDATVDERSSVSTGWSKIGPKRGLPPPVLACSASAAPNALGTTASRRAASEGTRSLRTTSINRGGSTTAISDPPAKITWPRHHENPSDTRWAPNGPELLGVGHGAEGETTAGRAPRAAARRPGAFERGGDHAGDGDRRDGVDHDPRGCERAELPGECGDRPLGAAVGTGVGRPPARARRDAEDPTVSGRGHDRQGGAQHVEVPVEMDRQDAEPVLLAPAGEGGGSGDAGDVDDGVEASELLDQPAEQVAHADGVGHRHRRGTRRPSGGHDPIGRGLPCRREPLGAVEGDEGVDGHDDVAVATELLGDGGPDPGAATGDDDHPPGSAGLPGWGHLRSWDQSFRPVLDAPARRGGAGSGTRWRRPFSRRRRRRDPAQGPRVTVCHGRAPLGSRRVPPDPPTEKTVSAPQQREDSRPRTSLLNPRGRRRLTRAAGTARRRRRRRWCRLADMTTVTVVSEGRRR